jgi:hypothetical protein
MSKHTFTPGPWTVFNDRIEAWENHPHFHFVICQMEDLPEKRSNADLIAAAPEMLAALRRAYADEMFNDLHLPTKRVITESISKATGGQP